MEEEMSKAMRNQGEQIAFDHGQWEFQSRQLAYSANFLLESHVEMMKKKIRRCFTSSYFSVSYFFSN